MNPSRPSNIPPDDSSRIELLLIQMRIDIASCFIENGGDSPVYFRNRTLLESWIGSCGLTKRTDLRKTIEVSGWVQTKSGRCWTHQLWVRRDNSSHKPIFLNLVASKHNVSELDGTKINVDHVVNKKSVQNPDAWILLFPVPAHVNQVYGSVVERRLPEIPKDVDRGDMTKIMCFKLFCERIPNNPKEFEREMRGIREQIYNAAFCDQMETDIRPYIENRPRYSSATEDETDTMPLPLFEGHMVRWIGKRNG